ncbi:Uncharacterized protein TCM_011107 [Theobroma cacao]|uniref:RNase H type-1 domain-containing protein n=1 Tax=Theobroma cacao TaxID=3641 RepID=A0A061E9A7_THECC|nr:Uncharacterized protein TCM_011107 [Theobroma cacao]
MRNRLDTLEVLLFLHLVYLFPISNLQTTQSFSCVWKFRVCVIYDVSYIALRWSSVSTVNSHASFQWEFQTPWTARFLLQWYGPSLLYMTYIIEKNLIMSATLWLARNDSILNSKGDDSIDDLGWWFEPRNSLMKRAPLHHHFGSWMPTPLGEYKFNIDGSTRSKLGLAGCGGVLSNSNGLVIKIFFKPLGLLGLNHAEFMAILKALHLFVASPYANCPLTIELNSRVALSWVKTIEQQSWDK